MYGFEQLKPQLVADADETTCPVRDCSVRRPKQRKRFLPHDAFKCPLHGIYFSDSTFEHVSAHDNLLWHSAEDLALLETLRPLKRESRMARERSEDAVTWNVFRHLERSGRLPAWAASAIRQPVSTATAHYWSCDRERRSVWAPLAHARADFGELPKRETEPDLVIEAPEVDIWLEAKVGASNKTKPSEPVGAEARYAAGADGWYSSVCRSPFATIAVAGERYELLRHWLLGSRAAQQRGKRFVLVNLVREGDAEDIEDFAARHFKLSADRAFVRVTWESIRGFLRGSKDCSADDLRLIQYLDEKSLGYDRAGRLLRAFSP